MTKHSQKGIVKSLQSRFPHLVEDIELSAAAIEDAYKIVRKSTIESYKRDRRAITTLAQSGAMPGAVAKYFVSQLVDPPEPGTADIHAYVGKAPAKSKKAPAKNEITGVDVVQIEPPTTYPWRGVAPTSATLLPGTYTFRATAVIGGVQRTQPKTFDIKSRRTTPVNFEFPEEAKAAKPAAFPKKIEVSIPQLTPPPPPPPEERPPEERPSAEGGAGAVLVTINRPSESRPGELEHAQGVKVNLNGAHIGDTDANGTVYKDELATGVYTLTFELSGELARKYLALKPRRFAITSENLYVEISITLESAEIPELSAGGAWAAMKNAKGTPWQEFPKAWKEDKAFGVVKAGVKWGWGIIAWLLWLMLSPILSQFIPVSLPVATIILLVWAYSIFPAIFSLVIWSLELAFITGTGFIFTGLLGISFPGYYTGGALDPTVAWIVLVVLSIGAAGASLYFQAIKPTRKLRQEAEKAKSEGRKPPEINMFQVVKDVIDSGVAGLVMTPAAFILADFFAVSMGVPWWGFLILGAVGLVMLSGTIMGAFNLKFSKWPIIITLGSVLVVFTIIGIATGLNTLGELIFTVVVLLPLGIFAIYPAGKLQIINILAIVMLVLGYFAAGPYAAQFAEFADQIKAPIASLTSGIGASTSDIGLLITNPTEYYAQQQARAARPEKPISYPMAVELARLDLVPEGTAPANSEFVIFALAENQGDLEAKDVKLTAKCVPGTAGTTCTPAEQSYLPQPSNMLPGMAFQTSFTFTAQGRTETKRAAETVYNKVNVTLSYKLNTSSSLQVEVATQDEIFTRQRDKIGKVFYPQVAIAKVSSAQIGMNVGLQPVYSGKQAILLLSIFNKRPDGDIVLDNSKMNVVLSEAVGSNLKCNSTGIFISSCPDGGGRRCQLTISNFTISYTTPVIPTIRCTFDAVHIDAGSLTGLITAELTDYGFSITKQKSIAVGAPMGIY